MSRRFKLVSGSLGLLSFFVVLTKPASIPSVLLAVPFILIFIIVYSLINKALQWQGLTGLKNARISVIATVFPVLLLTLQAFGQLTFRDLCTIVVLFSIGYFYLVRITAPSTE